MVKPNFTTRESMHMLNWLHGNKVRENEKPKRRIAVIEGAIVDRKRSLVLIRRDNIEHLMMIGGPTDVVIEPNIVRTAAPRELARFAMPRPARPAAETLEAIKSPEVPASPVRTRDIAPGVTSAADHRTSPQMVHNLDELTRQLEEALSRAPAPHRRSPDTVTGANGAGKGSGAEERTNSKSEFEPPISQN
jgi:hypothetical protein